VKTFFDNSTPMMDPNTESST
jgi:hypothetical protein